ncbi:MAG: YebC/PmpR family DNA-binding transcriptional regulator, partial [Gammaproteobacteria bacterium]
TDAGIEPDLAEVVQRPSNKIELDGEATVSVSKLIDAMEELDDVQEVSSNVIFDSDALEQI